MIPILINEIVNVKEKFAELMVEIEILEVKFDGKTFNSINCPPRRKNPRSDI